jgi:hypothetical protein
MATQPPSPSRSSDPPPPSAPPVPAAPDGVSPSGSVVQIDSVESSGEGSTTIHLKRLAPKSELELKSKTITTVQAEDQGRTMEMDMEMRVLLDNK